MKKKILILVLIIAAFFAWQYRFAVYKFIGKLPQLASTVDVANLLGNLKQEISTPGPLRSNQNYPNSVLTNAGVIYWTNVQRKQNGNLPALTENPKLDLAAAAKVKDMFAKQYFEHVSPSGVGPADLAITYGYQYILEGENLALGNFKDDQALVQAWMNSPGHRANILNSRYVNIGVAVGKGTFEGQTVWLAVQEFGKPLSDCPAVDASLKAQIANLQAAIKQEENQLAQIKAELAASNPKTQQEYNDYNQKVAQYNHLVQDHNAKAEILKQDVSTYNSQVAAFNACAQ